MEGVGSLIGVGANAPPLQPFQVNTAFTPTTSTSSASSVSATALKWARRTVSLPPNARGCHIVTSKGHLTPGKHTIEEADGMSAHVKSSMFRCSRMIPFAKGKLSMGTSEEPLENSIGDSGKKLSLEEILRQQIEKQEYEDQEGSGGSPPSDGGGGRGRGCGGRGGGGGDFGSSEEETPAERLDELLQVTLATMGLIFLYLYVLHGPEITRFAKDCCRFVLTGNKSIRLKRALYAWGRFCKALTRRKRVVTAEDITPLLQRELLNTPTWFDSPSKYKRIVKAYIAAKLSESEA